MNRAFRRLASADVVLAVFVVGIVGTLLVPLPPAVLDVLLVLNIGLSLTLLVSALRVERPLALSSFPTLLLIATLFRLALNVSSTRLILGTASAGEVIEAFGRFVVGGDYLVGAVVFVILVVIQLLVVAKGAERVAEVGARFTLDGLPGKQLAVDADIRAGACTQAEGAARRRALEQESQFYGALDGAMKFVKGDAVAGLVITGVNVLGGLAAGTLVQGLPLGEAAGTYTLLSIGDGLVSMLPALLTAVAAGLVVTRVSDGTHRLAGDLARQLGADPQVPAVVAGMLGVLACVPGLPAVPFMLLAAASGGAAWVLRRRRQAEREAAQAPCAPAPTAAAGDDAGVPEGPLVLELGGEVPAGVVEELVADALPAMRRRLGAELGIALPGIRLRPGRLAGRAWALHVDDVPVGGGTLPAGPALRIEPAEAGLLGLSGRPLPAGDGPWFELEGAPDRAELAGHPVHAPGAVLAAQLGTLVRAHAAELLTLEATQQMIDRAEAHAPTAVREVASRVPASLLCEVLRRLLEEGVSLRRFDRILETLASAPECGTGPQAVWTLLALVRRGLGRQLVHAHSRDGVLPVLLLDPVTEDLLRESLVQTPEGPTLALAPEHRTALQEALAREVGTEGGVLLVGAELRRFVWRLAGAVSPRIGVLAYPELPADAQVQPLARIAIEGLDPLLLAA